MSGRAIAIRCWLTSRRLLRRSLFKAIDVDPRKYNRMQRLQKRAEELVRAQLPHVTPTTVQYYVSVDEPERVSYRRYDWRNADPDESIWIVDNDRSAAPPRTTPAPTPSPSTKSRAASSPPCRPPNTSTASSSRPRSATR